MATKLIIIEGAQGTEYYKGLRNNHQLPEDVVYCSEQAIIRFPHDEDELYYDPEIKTFVFDGIIPENNHTNLTQTANSLIDLSKLNRTIILIGTDSQYFDQLINPDNIFYPEQPKGYSNVQLKETIL